ncbi:MAG TPA: hypothetical protein VHB48_07090 [Chitinophagaceae bacterium]|nr:hypothetical protein [Chitinophagaceae bacterium]
MRKKFPLIIVWLIVTGLIVCYLINLYQLISKSYYIDESKLYKVDTFHLLNRAYQESDYSRKYHSYSKLVFESTNGYSFAIDKHIFEAVDKKKELEDTMMYAGLKFTLFTDKNYFDHYKTSAYPIFIRAYQIQIGDVKYVDIKKMNEITKGYIKRGVFIPPVLIFFLGLLYKQHQNDNWWTKRRIMFWCIAFILITIGLLLLT